jgi:hypothetical protein
MIQNLFSTQIWHSSLNVKDSIKNKVLYDIEENFQKNKYNPSISDYCNIHTSFLEKNDIINYNELIPYFKEEYEKFCTQINLHLHKYSIYKTWYNYYLSGCNIEYHDHLGPLKTITHSMVYFLKLNDNHPKITFHNYTNYHILYSTNLEMKKIYPKDDINHSIIHPFWNLDVKEGDLIIFPSYLPHGVFLQKIDDPRITISSNILLL